MLAIEGGLAFGIRLMILKSNLLISDQKLFALVWGLIVLCGLIGAAGFGAASLKLWKEKYTLVCCPIVLKSVFASVY